MGVGLRYILNSDILPYEKSNQTIPNKFYDIHSTLSAAVKKQGRFNKKNYFASSLNINIGLVNMRNRRFGVGLDFFYDQSGPVSIINEESDACLKDYSRVGIHLLHDITFKKLTASIHLGTYMYTYNTMKEFASIRFLNLLISYYVIK
ncbi:MAG: hypothetical protein HC906_19505 [Bacteroidales bacterium]|nr:hypothetical protein [Bacteroidales bacterium]